MNAPSKQYNPVWAPDNNPVCFPDLARLFEANRPYTREPAVTRELADTPHWDPNWTFTIPQQQPPQFAHTLQWDPAPLLDPEVLARVIGLQQIIGYLEDG